MTAVLDVYDVTNMTYLGTLAEPYGVEWVDDVRIPGMLRFAVDVASEADQALLQPRRVVRLRTGESPGEGDLPPGGIVQDRPASLVSDVQPEPGKTVTVVTFPCPGLLAWLGYAQGGGVLETAGAFDGSDLSVVRGRQLSPRPFGWFIPEFDDGDWITPTSYGRQDQQPPSSGPIVQGFSGWPSDWPTPQAEFIWSRPVTQWSEGGGGDGIGWENAEGWVPFRGVWEDAPVGEIVRVYVSLISYGAFYVDGEEVLNNEGTTNRDAWRTPVRIEFEVTDPTVHFAAKVARLPGKNTPGYDRVAAFLMAVVSIGEGDDPEHNLFWTDTDNWVTLDYPDPFPGVTPGYVLRAGIQECHLRGELTQVALDDNVTLATDSNEDPWDRTVNHSFRVQEIGGLVDELADFRSEPEMGLDNVLRLYNRRGTDRTATVTVAAPFALDLTGRGVQATRYFYETQGGFGRAVNEPAEAELDVVMAKVVQFGTSLGPDEHGQPVADRLIRDGRVVDEVEVDLPDDVVPYVDVFPGDLVTCQGRDGVVPVRIMSISGELSRAGDIEWSAMAEPADG